MGRQNQIENEERLDPVRRSASVRVKVQGRHVAPLNQWDNGCTNARGSLLVAPEVQTSDVFTTGCFFN